MSESITEAVRSRYGAVAESTISTNTPGAKAIAEAFGYSDEELRSIPADANMGLSCGNPTALAHLRAGEVVVDLGCGGGLDVFLAAAKVGPTGRAIGIDMTPAMVERARRSAAKGPDGKPYTNVEIHLATIDRMPLEDNSVDVVISNCVINLATDKPAVFREIERVLKPGGRLVASDIALRKALPEALAASVAAYVGCIAGAIEISEYEKGLRDAGFHTVQVVDSGADLNAYAKMETQSACCSPGMAIATPATAAGRSSLSVIETACCRPAGPDAESVHDSLRNTLSQYDVNDYAASVKVYALKSKTK